MATQAQPISYFIDVFRNQMQASGGRLTDFSTGSLNDILSGAVGIATNELQQHLITEIRKTYFGAASGPDLDALALDHFGGSFSRPQPTSSNVVLTVSRDDATAAITIPQGTSFATEPDIDGNVVTFLSTEAATMAVGVSSASVQSTSDSTGSDQNVGPGLVTGISGFEDLEVENAAAATGGRDEATDEEYRLFIINSLQSVAGGTKESLETSLLALDGISSVSLTEVSTPVIEYDLDTQKAKVGGAIFRFNRPVAYISSDGPVTNPDTITDAEAVVDRFRACGVEVTIESAVVIPITVNVAVITTGESGITNTDIIEAVEEFVNDDSNTPVGGFVIPGANWDSSADVDPTPNSITKFIVDRFGDRGLLMLLVDINGQKFQVGPVEGTKYLIKEVNVS